MYLRALLLSGRGRVCPSKFRESTALVPFEYIFITSMFLYGVVHAGASELPSGGVSDAAFVPF